MGFGFPLSPDPASRLFGIDCKIACEYKVWSEQFIEGYRRRYTVNKSLHCSMALARILETGHLAALLEPSGPCCKRGFGLGSPLADLNSTQTRVADIQRKVSNRVDR